MAVPVRTTATPARRRRTSASPARSPRPAGDHLRVVPARRRAAGLVFVAAIVLAGLMLGAAVLNTTLAERQLRVDDLEQQVGDARDRFEVLRGHRAELRAPGRLSREATALGMYPGVGGVFVRPDRNTYAETLAAVGSVDEANRIVRDEQPLDQFRRVKVGGR